MGWVGGTHPILYHVHYDTSGMGQLYQQRYKSFLIQNNDYFLIVCRYVARNALRTGRVCSTRYVGRRGNWRAISMRRTAVSLISI